MHRIPWYPTCTFQTATWMIDFSPLNQKVSLFSWKTNVAMVSQHFKARPEFMWLFLKMRKGFCPLLPRATPTKTTSSAQRPWECWGISVGASTPPAHWRTWSKQPLGCVLEGAGSSRVTLTFTLCVGANTKKLRMKRWLIMTLMQNLLLKTIPIHFCWPFHVLTRNERNRAFSCFLCKQKSYHPPHIFADKMTMNTLS